MLQSGYIYQGKNGFGRFIMLEKLTNSTLQVSLVVKNWVWRNYLQVPQPFRECFPEVRLLFAGVLEASIDFIVLDVCVGLVTVSLASAMIGDGEKSIDI